jgi:CDP-glucose 4,6-dehydratase
MKIPLGQRLRELPGPVLLTGHTGFKGTWMTFLLEHLNVPVVGYSLSAEHDSLYDRAQRKGAIPEEYGDIRDYERLEQFMDLHKPSTIIHMAAQPLVLKSYESPRETFDVNVMGTVNLLDIAFKKDFVKAIVVVTTDKVYRNDNSGKAFVETDPLEGKDPYSASKVGTEAVVAAWQQIARVYGGPEVVSARAGNVVGGGDFAANRIIPDLVRSVILSKPIGIRNPLSTRPWQHVIELTYGYVALLEAILMGAKIKCINFGPSGLDTNVRKVIEIAERILSGVSVFDSEKTDDDVEVESTILNLDSNLASSQIQWACIWRQELSIEKTFKWWDQYINQGSNAYELCMNEIAEFFELDEQKSAN